MSTDPEKVREWALVLASQGIPYRIAQGPDGWELVIHPNDAPRAEAALGAYVRENAPDEADTAKPAGLHLSRAAIGAALALVGFHAVTGAWSAASPWFAAGSANAAAVRQGEVWRLVTALTLHADMGHVLANAVTLVLFGTAVLSLVGPGVGLWLIVLAGTLGNGVNVMVRWAGYDGVGASTAVFGAVGLLVGLQVARPGRRVGSRSQALASGVLLLALLGMSEQSDVMAHVLGLVMGVGLGAAWSRVGPGTIGTRAQAALLAGLVAFVAGCWWLARGTLS